MCGPHRAHNFEGPQIFYIDIVIFLKKMPKLCRTGPLGAGVGPSRGRRALVPRSLNGKRIARCSQKKETARSKNKGSLQACNSRPGSPRSETAIAVPSAAQHKTSSPRRLSPSPVVVAFVAASPNFQGSILQSVAVLSPLLQETRSPHRTYP